MQHSAALEEPHEALSQTAQPAQPRPVLNINKLQATVCILLSAVVSVTGIVFLIRAFS